MEKLTKSITNQKPVMGLLELILVLIAMATFYATLTYLQNWPYYHRIYNCLDEMTFEEEVPGVVVGKSGMTEITLYTRDDIHPNISRGCFLLGEGVNSKAISNSWITYFDPYTFYWWTKYVNWSKENTEYVDEDEDYNLVTYFFNSFKDQNKLGSEYEDSKSSVES